jgi:hypothetical protein
MEVSRDGYTIHPVGFNIRSKHDARLLCKLVNSDFRSEKKDAFS